MADLLDLVREKIDGQIDFEGQRLAEQISTNALAIIGLIAFVIGYATQNIQYTLWTMVGGAVVVFLAVLPPWPAYNKHPVQWLPSQGDLATMGLRFGQSGS